MIKYVVQIICEQETCGSVRGLKCNTCKEIGTASHVDPFLPFSFFKLQVSSFFPYHPLMFKFILTDLLDCMRPIAALFLKLQQKNWMMLRFGFAHPLSLGKTP